MAQIKATGLFPSRLAHSRIGDITFRAEYHVVIEDPGTSAHVAILVLFRHNPAQLKRITVPGAQELQTGKIKAFCVLSGFPLKPAANIFNPTHLKLRLSKAAQA
jgi:hypothetical protein